MISKTSGTNIMPTASGKKTSNLMSLPGLSIRLTPTAMAKTERSPEMADKTKQTIAVIFMGLRCFRITPNVLAPPQPAVAEASDNRIPNGTKMPSAAAVQCTAWLCQDLHLLDVKNQYRVFGNTLNILVAVAEVWACSELSSASRAHTLQSVPESRHQIAVADGERRLFIASQVVTAIEPNVIPHTNPVAFLNFCAGPGSVRNDLDSGFRHNVEG